MLDALDTHYRAGDQTARAFEALAALAVASAVTLSAGYPDHIALMDSFFRGTLWAHLERLVGSHWEHRS